MTERGLLLLMPMPGRVYPTQFWPSRGSTLSICKLGSCLLTSSGGYTRKVTQGIGRRQYAGVDGQSQRHA